MYVPLWGYILSSLQRYWPRNVLHSEDLFQMGVFLTRTVTQVATAQNNRFNALDARLQLLSTGVDSLAAEMLQAHTELEKTVDGILSTTTQSATTVHTLTDRLDKGPSLRQTEDSFHRLQKGMEAVATVLRECQAQSRKLRDALQDTRRLENRREH